MENYYKNYVDVHHAALDNLEITDRDGESLGHNKGFDVLCEMSRQVRDGGRKQYLIGNGASAAFANHMALDWTKNGGVPSYAFANSALITAIGNDLGYEEVFSAPLSWYAKSGDLLLAISSSGNSLNIIKTIEVARSKGLKVISLSGLKPSNVLRELGDVNLYIPAKTYGIVECAHQVILHVWLDKFMGISEWDRDGFQNMNKDQFCLY